MMQTSFIREFEKQVSKTPNQIALAADKKILSYIDLNERANQWAHLIRQCYRERYLAEMPHETLIAFCLPRGLEAYVIILGILKAGGAYIALDPTHPVERLQWILQDSQAALFMTQSDKGFDADLYVDEKSRLQLLEKQSRHNLQLNISPQALAYVVYTSGSTGQPKGVMIAQPSIMRLVRQTNYITIEASDRMAALSNLAFDACTFEIWGAWLNGAVLLISPQDVFDSIQTLESYLIDQCVTIAFFTTALFHLAATVNPGMFKNLRYLLFGGDLINIKKVKAVFNCGAGSPQHLLHVYGPTENTTFSTAYEVKAVSQEYDTLPIGNFITGSHGYVLNAAFEMCQIGETGELYLGGAGLARGYMHHPELDEERFVYPLTKEERLYRTGDLVRLTAEGHLVFVGRADLQVKIQGFRVEIAEIETVLNRHPHIQDAAVILQGESSEQKHLIAYCVIEKEKKELMKNVALEYWTHLYDELYSLPKNNEKSVDFSGWNSSFTQELIPESDMLEWRNATVERIRQLNPRCILEIGCGSGLLLFPLLDFCEVYRGIDISQKVISRLTHLLERQGFSQVKLERGAAHNLDYLSILSPEEKIDTIVMNSVSMHFPHIDYLTEVITTASKKIKTGKIFIGDVRDYRLLPLFHWAITRFQNASLNAEEAYHLSLYNLNNERELLTSPEYFLNLSNVLPHLSYVEILPKRGYALHEMNCFRFDVILHFNATQKKPTPIMWKNAEEILDLREYLQQSHVPVVGVHCYPNLRIWTDYQMLATLQSLTKVELLIENYLDLEMLHQLAKEEGFELHAYCSVEKKMAAAFYQLVFVKQGTNFVPSNAVHGEVQSECYANTPVVLSASANIYSFKHLSEDIKKILPDYMCPSEYIQLDTLPMTANGKVDRKALRSFKLNAHEVQPCIDSIQYKLILIWEAIFEKSPLSAKVNFLSLGGNSILAIQMIHRVNEAFNIEHPVAWIFTHQTIAEQADDLRKRSTLFARYHPIIHFNKLSSTVPFYMVHPGLIGAECYAELANLLDRHIGFKGIDSFNLYNDPMKSSITELAQYYTEVLLENCAEKSIYLGGWSMGGLIAYEMTLALQKRGVRVIKLLLIEPDPPDYQNKLIENNEAIDPSKLNNTADYIQEYLKKLPESIIGRVLSNLTQDLRLCVDYQPTNTFSGEALIFEAEYWRDDDLIGKKSNLLEAWSPYIKKIRAIPVPGNHLSIMDHPNIKFVAERISQEILTET